MRQISLSGSSEGHLRVDTYSGAQKIVSKSDALGSPSRVKHLESSTSVALIITETLAVLLLSVTPGIHGKRWAQLRAAALAV